MKAIAKLKKKPGLSLTDVSKPEIGRDDVLVKIRKTAICGTDLHIYNWDEWAQKTIPVPMHIGHEFMGKIVEIGADVKGFKVGDRVSGEGHIVCGYCRNCRAGQRHLCRNTIGIGVNRIGAFAEYLALPATNAFLLPDNVSEDVGSILDPLGNATHTALAFDLVGEDVLITGAGPVGLMSVAIARHIGARHIVITDINEFRLAKARELGVSLAINPQKSSLNDAMKELNMTEGFDVGLEMSGNPQAFCQMLEVMNHGGNIAFLGIPPEDFSINWHLVIFKGLNIQGIYGRRMFETWYKMVSMLQSGLDITPVITHHIPADDFEEAFNVVASGKAGKVILDWV